MAREKKSTQQKGHARLWLLLLLILLIPLLQLILFGYAINSDPRHLPTAILSADNSPFSRAIVYAMRNSTFFQLRRDIDSRAQARDLLARGDVQFVLTIPEDFSRDLIRGEKPTLLLEADATDPVATGGSLAAFREIANRAVNREVGFLFPALAIALRVYVSFSRHAGVGPGHWPGFTFDAFSPDRAGDFAQG